MKELKRSGSYLRSVTAFCAIAYWSAALPSCAQEVSSSQPAPTPSELNVAHQEVTVLDFASAQTLSIAGDITNAGTIYLVSSNPQVTSGVLSALNITNSATGTITSVLPSGGLAGFDFLVPNFSFTLAAAQNIANAGVISSAGALTMTAGNAISNTGVAGSQALIQALGAINMFSGAGTILNQGAIASATGNINLTAPVLQNLIINNQGGVLSALQGAVTLRNSLVDTKTNTAILGGDILARELNIFSGCGKAVVNVNEISGVLNINAGEAHVTAASPNLHLGQMNLIDDPTFFNVAGDVIIDTSLNFAGFPIAIVAKGDVLTASGAGKISTSNSAGNAGDITIIAGAEFVSSQPNFTSPFADVTLTITGASNSGGKIALSGANPITGLEAKATGTTGRGGNVLLVAYQGVAAGSGTISLPTNVTVETGGISRNGDVAVLGGGAGGNVITMGGVNTGQANTGGSINILEGPIYTDNVTLTNARLTSPNTTQPLLIQNDPNRPLPAEAMYSIGGFTVVTAATNFPLLNITPNPYNTSNYAAGNITTGTLTARGREVNVLARGSVLTGSIDVSGMFGYNGGAVTIRSSKAGSTFSVAPGATFGVNGTINAQSGPMGGAGGSIRLLIDSHIAISSADSLSVASTAGAGGLLQITSGNYTFNTFTGTVTLGSGSYSASATGGDFNGGSILIKGTSINTGGPVSFTADAAGGGNGGSIDLRGGTFLIGPALEIYARGGSPGSSSGDGGSISLAGVVSFDQTFASAQPLGLNGAGGKYSFETSGKLDALSLFSIDASGVGFGDGGSVYASLSNTSPFVIGPSGAQFTATSGHSGGKGGSVTVSTENILVEDFAFINVQQSLGDGGTIVLGPFFSEGEFHDGGIVSVPVGTIDVSGVGEGTSGGRVAIQGLQLQTGSSRGPLSILANGTSNGSGGSIYIGATAGEMLTIGSADDELQLSATGGAPGRDSGNGGSVTLRTDTALLLNELPHVNPQGDNGNGGALKLSALEITWDGDIIADGVGLGAGGTILLESRSSADKFSIGTRFASPNSISGRVSAVGFDGGSITLLSAGALEIIDPLAVDVTAFSGKGGSLEFNSGSQDLVLAPGIYAANSGGDGPGGHVGMTFGNFAVVGTGNVAIQANGANNYDGGDVFVRSLSNGTIPIGTGEGEISISAIGGSAGSDQGNGGQVVLQNVFTSGQFFISSDGIDVSPQGTNGNGGSLHFSGSTLYFGHLNLDGVGTGSGGSFTTSFATDYSIGAGFAPRGVTGNISARGGSNGGAGGQISLNHGNLVLGSGASLNASGADGTGSISIQHSNFGAATLKLPGGTYGAPGLGSFNISIDQIIPSGGTGPVSFVADTLNINSGYNTFTLGQNTGQFTVTANDARVYANNIVADPNAINVPGTLTLHGVFTVKVNGSLQGIDNLKLHYGTFFANTFVVGGAVTSSGVTGTIDVGSFTLIPQNAVGSINLNVQGTISTQDGMTIAVFRDHQPTNITGTGTINGPLNVVGGEVTINLPGTSPLEIGAITSTGGGAVSITVPSMILPDSTSKIVSAGPITLNIGDILNNGVISTTQSLKVQNPAGVKITGTGVMAGNPVNFTSTAGKVDVTQGLVLGTITGSGLKGFSVTFGSRLTTSQLLNPTLNQNVLLNASRAVTNVTITQTNVSSVVLNTDTVMRKVSLLKDDAVNYQRANQVFVLACTDGESDLYCEEDTEVESDEYNATILSSGKMLVDTGNKERVVKAGRASFVVPAQSSALVERRNGRVRVVALGGKNAVVANVNGTAHSVKPGQDLLIGEDLADEEEFISVDQTSAPISASIEKLSHTVHRRTTTVVNAVKREIMIGGVMVSIGGRASDRQKRVMAHLDQSVKSENPLASIFDSAYWSKSIPLSKGGTVNVLHSLGTEITIAGDKQINLRNGCMFLEPKIDTVINAGTVKISCKQHVPLQIERNGAIVKVKGFGGINGIEVISGNQRTTLSAGQELCVTHGDIGDKVAFSDGIGRRVLSSRPVADGRETLSQFSITSALLNGAHLKQLINARNAELKQERDKVLKTAAALHVIHPHQAYKSE